MGVSYIPVARVGELSPGAMKEVDLGGRQVLLAFVEGKYFAFSRQCPHEEADLKEAGQLIASARKSAATIIVIVSIFRAANAPCRKAARR